MTAFIGIAALLIAVAVGFLAWPLLRPRGETAGGARAPVAAAVLGAVLPVAAFLLYFSLSNWDWRAPAAPPNLTAPDLQRVVSELQSRLEQQPDDTQGWKLLGRSATVLGDYALARRAFGEAFERTEGSDPEAIVGLAESMILLDERAIDGEAAELFERALELAPDNARALWYGGIVAYRRGDLGTAQRRWVELQDHELPSDLRQVLAERLAELERSQGEPAAAAARPADANAVDLTIDMEPSLASRVPEDATLFVIARRAGAGPPVAVQRRPAGSWPVTVRLGDADAMLPGTRLADAGPLTIIARVSLSGQPMAARGDLFGEVGYDFASAHPVNLTIDRIVP